MTVPGVQQPDDGAQVQQPDDSDQFQQLLVAVLLLLIVEESELEHVSWRPCRDDTEHLPCRAVPCHAMPCHAMPCHAIHARSNGVTPTIFNAYVVVVVVLLLLLLWWWWWWW